MMNFCIQKISRPEGAYKLTLVSESINSWENDLVSHDATAKEYVVIQLNERASEEAIAAANKDYTKTQES